LVGVSVFASRSAVIGIIAGATVSAPEAKTQRDHRSRIFSIREKVICLLIGSIRGHQEGTVCSPADARSALAALRIDGPRA
jgi:hypothetical protein